MEQIDWEDSDYRTLKEVMDYVEDLGYQPAFVYKVEDGSVVVTAPDLDGLIFRERYDTLELVYKDKAIYIQDIRNFAEDCEVVVSKEKYLVNAQCYDEFQDYRSAENIGQKTDSVARIIKKFIYDDILSDMNHTKIESVDDPVFMLDLCLAAQGKEPELFTKEELLNECFGIFDEYVRIRKARRKHS
jgi:hypothetical protein